MPFTYLLADVFITLGTLGNMNSLRLDPIMQSNATQIEPYSRRSHHLGQALTAHQVVS